MIQLYIVLCSIALQSGHCTGDRIWIGTGEFFPTLAECWPVASDRENRLNLRPGWVNVLNFATCLPK